MTTIDNQKFVAALSNDEAYALRVAEVTTPKALVELMKEKDITVTIEEAADLLRQAKEKMESDELDEEVLDVVNGGLGYLATCAAFGGAAGVVLGLCAVGLYYAYRKNFR